MGGGQSCKIDKFSNACEIYKCVEGVIGLKSESASPSDQWIVKLKNATYDDTPIEQVFLKYWSESDIKGNTTDAIYALNYEMWTYKHIIYKLRKRKICPNFIAYLASGKFCTASQINEITKHSNISGKNLIRNIAYMIYHMKNRPAIHTDNQDDVTQLNKVLPFFSSMRFHMLITEYVDGLSLCTYCRAKPEELELKKILFQIAVGCYAMNLSKMVHNDMHSFNILLSTNRDELSYYIEGTVYKFKPKYLVRIFDFDHAYVERYKHNKDENRNTLCNGLDMFILIAHLCHFIDNPKNIYLDVTKLQDYLIKSVLNDTNDSGAVETIKKYYMKHQFDIKADWCNKHIKPTLEIIKEQGKGFIHARFNECMYHCSADMFDESGRILSEEALKLRAENSNLKRATVVGGALSLGTIAAIGMRSRK